MPPHREYLGDGVYASFDGFQVWLYAERDGRVHEIAVEDPVIDALVRFRRSISERRPCS